jgi:hypothetical protein
MSGFAPNAVVVNPDAPRGMLAVTAVVTVGPDDEGTGAGVGPIDDESTDELLVLQAAAARRTAATIAKRIRIRSPLGNASALHLAIVLPRARELESTVGRPEGCQN